MSKRIIVPPEELEGINERLKKIEKLLKTEQNHIEDPVLDTEGVMKLLTVSRRCLQTWRDQGVIQFSAVHGKFYYRLSAINKMLDEHLQTAHDNKEGGMYV